MLTMVAHSSSSEDVAGVGGVLGDVQRKYMQQGEMTSGNERSDRAIVTWFLNPI